MAGKLELFTVHIETKTDATYVFPDVSKEDINRILRPGPPQDSSTLQLINISVALLSLPWGIVDTIVAYLQEDGPDVSMPETVWKRPGSSVVRLEVKTRV